MMLSLPFLRRAMTVAPYAASAATTLYHFRHDTLRRYLL